MNLGGESSRVLIVLDAEGQLVLVLRAEQADGERLEVRIVLLLESSDVGLIKLLCHGVADRVVSEHAIGPLKAPNKEVLGIKVIAIVEGFPVGDAITADVFENYSLCCLVHPLAELCVHTADDRADRIMLLIVSDGKTADDVLSVGRMSVALRRVAGVEVVFKAISAVEELTDVASDVMLKDEATSWVSIDELFDIKHHFV